MENTISFIYNPHTYFESYKNVLNNVRLHYSDSDIFIYMDEFRDDLQKYIDESNKHNCNITIRQNKMFFIDRNDSIKINLPKMIEWFERLKLTCENTNSEWIMLLEDDVMIKRKIKYWPKSDCGKNRHDCGFCGGGSILKRKVFLEIFEKFGILGIENVIQSNFTYSWAADALLQRLYNDFGASNEKWIELPEPNYHDNIA
jgi:hypothetical protein